MPVTGFARAWPALPAIAVIAGVLLWLSFEQGGYFPAEFTAAGAIAFIALAALIVSQVRRLPGPAVAAIGALSAYACWMGLSRAWSPVPDVPLLDMQRAMLYIALLGLGLLASNAALNARVLVWCLLAVTVVVAGAGLLSRVQPDMLQAPIDPFDTSFRLAYPLGYWNALGAMASLGAVLALGLAADARGSTVLRAAAAGACALLVATMYLSLSRGAWLTLVLGIVVLLAITPNRGTLLLTLLVAGGAATAAILRLRGHDALVLDPRAGTGQEAQGDAFTREFVVLVVLAVAAQAALATVAAGRVMTRLGERVSGIRRVVLVGAGIAIVLVALAGYAATGHDVKGEVEGANGWLDRQWRDFQTPASSPGTSTTRLLSAKGERSDVYRVAFEGFEEHPLVGGGAGSFEVRYARDRRIDLKLRNAHSLPLETLSELGAIGMLLLIGFLAAVVIAARRALSQDAAIRPAEAAAVTAAFGVWFVHAGIDWDWQMPALTGTALVLSAALLARAREVPRAAPVRGRGAAISIAARRGPRRPARQRSRVGSARLRGTPTAMMRRGWPRIVAMVAVAVVVGAGVGIGLAQLGGGGGPPAADSGDQPPPETSKAVLNRVEVHVVDAVLLEAQTPSGEKRRRARLSVRIRVVNRSARRVRLERPVLEVAGTRTETDPRADTARSHLDALAGGGRAAVTLRFETAGIVTSAIKTLRHAQLLFADRSLRLAVTVDESERPPSGTGTATTPGTGTGTTPGTGTGTTPRTGTGTTPRTGTTTTPGTGTGNP